MVSSPRSRCALNSLVNHHVLMLTCKVVGKKVFYLWLASPCEVYNENADENVILEPGEM